MLCVHCLDPTPPTESVWLGDNDSERSGDSDEYAYDSDGYESFESGIFYLNLCLSIIPRFTLDVSLDRGR